MNMEPTEQGLRPEEKPQRLAEDWAEAEWFRVWLRLARREYQGQPDAPKALKQAA